MSDEEIYEPSERIRIVQISTGLTIPYRSADILQYLAGWARDHLAPHEYVWQINCGDENFDATLLICDGGGNEFPPAGGVS